MRIFAHHLEGLHFLNDTVLAIAILALAGTALITGLVIIRKSKKQTVTSREDSHNGDSL